MPTPQGKRAEAYAPYGVRASHMPEQFMPPYRVRAGHAEAVHAPYRVREGHAEASHAEAVHADPKPHEGVRTSWCCGLQ
jgi:hypothetical protein